MPKITLIANSGIQFYTTEEFELDTEGSYLDSGGRPMSQTYVDVVVTNPFTGASEHEFGLLSRSEDGNGFLSVDGLRQMNMLQKDDAGVECLDTSGTPVVKRGVDTAVVARKESGDTGVYTIVGLGSHSVRLEEPGGGVDYVPAMQALIGKWLPLPMYEAEVGCVDRPQGWCRFKMESLGAGSKKNTLRMRVLFAFDTEISDDYEQNMRPSFPGGEEKKNYAVSSSAEVIREFLLAVGQTVSGSRTFVYTEFGKYVSNLIGGDDGKSGVSYKHVAYYVYLVLLLRARGVLPEVVLSSGGSGIPVDMTIDIGNSRTCAMLFEEGDTRRSVPLHLTNISSPSADSLFRFGRGSSPVAFDMRLVFRKADFGNEMLPASDLFQYRSFVRLGDEALQLVYSSEAGLDDGNVLSSYSSPKRYLWDVERFGGRWKPMKVEGDPLTSQVADDIYVLGVSEYFSKDGSYRGEAQSVPSELQYSRSSLMTFVMIEIYTQAIMQMNSVGYHDLRGNDSSRRYIRNVIVTCPTSMPEFEQVRLRQSAEEALDVVGRVCRLPYKPVLTPSSSELARNSLDPMLPRAWNYDEATCSQFVWLYAEVNEKYKGNMKTFFDLKGHVRKDLASDDYHDKALTVGSIDIGAGTTDVMVMAYERMPGDSLKPVPLFYDSFYAAGDDILHGIVSSILLEGKDRGAVGLGSVRSSLLARLREMSAAELLEKDFIRRRSSYHQKVVEMSTLRSEEEIVRVKERLATDMLNDFFGDDHATQSYAERVVRHDFCVQVLHPMSQSLMELLRVERNECRLSFKDLLVGVKPSERVLDGFAQHFGFRFEELEWVYEPEAVVEVLRNVMGSLFNLISDTMHKLRCDVIVMSGRPSSLRATTDLFLKNLSVSPNRLVRMSDYRVGTWFPTSDGSGYFSDSKAVVAVGALVGFRASHGGFGKLSLDLSKLGKSMASTANYIGKYDEARRVVREVSLSPEESSCVLDISKGETLLGCKQFSSLGYMARPLMAIVNGSGRSPLKCRLLRVYSQGREAVSLEDVMDTMGNAVPKNEVRLRVQTLASEDGYWLDNGVFCLVVNS